jgi:hypothetical protein
MDICPVYKHTELFVFNRIEGGQVTYLAMETGYAHHPTALATSMQRWSVMLSSNREQPDKRVSHAV